MTSTIPGLSCVIDGTWLDRIPISPAVDGMLTCFLLVRRDRVAGDGHFFVGEDGLMGDGEAEFEVVAVVGGIGVGASEDGGDETIELGGTGECTDNCATGTCS
jgi:hypothetical protein